MHANMVMEQEICASETGGYAVSKLPLGYVGPCALLLQNNRTENPAAVFSTAGEAAAAASFAVGELGGYAHAVVVAAASSAVTHKHWRDWAFS